MKIEHDLELAHEVQRALLPRAAPEIAGYEFFAFYRAANQIGGDYYDYIALRDGRMAVVAADVAGHGIASAMMMAKVSAEAKYCLATESDPAHAVTRLNDRLCSMQIDRFVTLVLVVLDPVKHEVIIVNAGHMPPIWRHGDGTMEELGVEISNLPLGILDHLTYDQQTVSLAASDVLALYTDGINEAMNPAGKQFTIGRIRWHVQRTAHGLPIEEIGNALVDDVRNHISSGPQEDDMCLVLLRRK
jgi:serine phosphatase RsbU (regulator of sigma subunit)